MQGINGKVVPSDVTGMEEVTDIDYFLNLG